MFWEKTSCLSALFLTGVLSLSGRSSFVPRNKLLHCQQYPQWESPAPRFKHNQRFDLAMKDHSASYGFDMGSSVIVVEDVIKAGSNLKGRVGTVVETWEKCDVDPTCCCAEQVDPNMAVRVEFRGTEKDAAIQNESFTFYFAEEEIQIQNKDRLKEEPAQQEPFDGIGCVAFKLDQLQSDTPRQLASFDPNQRPK